MSESSLRFTFIFTEDVALNRLKKILAEKTDLERNIDFVK